MNALNQLLASIVAALAISAAAFAQPAGGFMGGNAGLDGVKSQIHSTDEEWKVIGPLLQSVVTCRATAEYSLLDQQGNPTGAFGGPNGGGRGGFGGGPGGRGDSFAEPGNPGGFGGGRGGFGGPGGPGGGPGNDSFGEPGAAGFGGPGGRGGFGRGGPGGFGPGGPDAGGALTNATGAFGGPANFNGPMGGGFPGMGANNAVALAVSQLGTTLSSTNLSSAELQEKMAAVRDARQKAMSDLNAAEVKLRRLLTFEQEVVLVSLGYLD